jgi:hypothetical protein
MSYFLFDRTDIDQLVGEIDAYLDLRGVRPRVLGIDEFRDWRPCPPRNVGMDHWDDDRKRQAVQREALGGNSRFSHA